MDAVLEGKSFVSSSLKSYELTGTAGEKLPHRHEVQFYSDDAVFLDTLARFIAVALKSGDAAIAVITESHWGGLVLRLKAQGLNVDAAVQEGRYVQLDVAKALSTFMVNNMPDEARFAEVVSGLIGAAAKAVKLRAWSRRGLWRMFAFLVGRKANWTPRFGVEQLWDEAGKTFGCGYPLWVSFEQLSRRGRRARFPRASVRNTQPFILSEK